MNRLILLLVLIPVSSFSQSIGIGQWRNHVSLNNVFSLDINGSKIYAASSQGIIVYDHAHESTETYSKTNVLSDVSVTAVRYDEIRKMLVVGYANGAIDLIKDGSTQNLTDIKRANITGDKGIRNIFIQDNLAYLATGFAIVVLDLEKHEVFDTYKFGNLGDAISVNDMLIHNGSIYAATDVGVYKASVNNPFLNNYENWTKLSGFNNSNGRFNSVESFANTVYVCYQNSNTSFSDEVYFLDQQSNWTRVEVEFGRYQSLRSSSDLLVVAAKDEVYVINTANQLVNTAESTTDYRLTATDALSAFGQVWIADNNFGLLSFSGNSTYQKHVPNCPLNNKIFKLSSSDSKIYDATGSVNQIFNNYVRQDGILIFDGVSWSYLDKTKSDSLKNVYDILYITPDPSNADRYYACSWANGLIEVNKDKVTQVFTDDNSAIQENPADANNFRIASADFDSLGNLWVANSCAPRNVVLKTSGNSWYSFKMGPDFGNAGGALISQILVSSDNSKWMIRHRNGLYVFNENGTYTNSLDDQERALTSAINDGGLPSNDVFCIAEDLDGEIWIGTDHGFAIIYNPSSALANEDVNADQPIIQQDGNYEKVLEQEIILAIAVDGGNRKWMATQNSGVYLLSEDGTKQIQHFTAENSPLLSNEVLSLTINPKTGEVFFGTTLGIQSYMSDATAPENSLEKISVYPSPVKPDYTGPIAMKGFVRDTDVKIADISGNVIFKTRSLGGEAIWDGKNFRGERVATGVYLIFAASPTGEESTVGKILYLH